MTKRKRYSIEFMARVALEAIREELTQAGLNYSPKGENVANLRLMYCPAAD